MIQKNVGSHFLETGCTFRSMWANLVFHCCWNEAWEEKVLFSAVLTAAGCSGLEAHQMFREPLLAAFSCYFWVVCIEVAHREVWQAVELAQSMWRGCADFQQQSACCVLWNCTLRNYSYENHYGVWNKNGKERSKTVDEQKLFSCIKKTLAM